MLHFEKQYTKFKYKYHSISKFLYYTLSTLPLLKQETVQRELRRFRFFSGATLSLQLKQHICLLIFSVIYYLKITVQY